MSLNYSVTNYRDSCLSNELWQGEAVGAIGIGRLHSTWVRLSLDLEDLRIYTVGQTKKQNRSQFYI